MLSSGMLHRVALVRTDTPLKCQYLHEPHGVTSQKTAFFVVTTMKTSNRATGVTVKFTLLMAELGRCVEALLYSVWMSIKVSIPLFF
jgi:hypothetical protein